jgi:hypothetical protein
MEDMTMTERERDDETDMEELEGIEFDDADLGATERRRGEDPTAADDAPPRREEGND